MLKSLSYMFNPDLADDDIVNTAVNVLPGIDFVVSVHHQQASRVN